MLKEEAVPVSPVPAPMNELPVTVEEKSALVPANGPVRVPPVRGRKPPFPFKTIFEMVTFRPDGAVMFSVTLYATGM
jgi:hypothetical protein